MTVCVLAGSAFVSASAMDGRYDDQPQQFWSIALRVLDQVQRVCGWTTPQLAQLQDMAAYVGVGPGGDVVRPTTLTEGELTAEVTALLHRLDPAGDLTRDLDPTLLQRYGAQVAGSLPADTPRVRIRLTLGSSGRSVGVDASPASISDVVDEVRNAEEVAFTALGELGDARTGRPVQLVIDVGAGEEPQVQVVFDVIPLEHGRPALGWEGHLVSFLERDPAWQPSWLPEARLLLQRAGRDV